MKGIPLQPSGWLIDGTMYTTEGAAEYFQERSKQLRELRRAEQGRQRTRRFYTRLCKAMRIPQ